jgi:hypothetical protein
MLRELWRNPHHSYGGRPRRELGASQVRNKSLCIWKESRILQKLRAKPLIWTIARLREIEKLEDFWCGRKVIQIYSYKTPAPLNLGVLKYADVYLEIYMLWIQAANLGCCPSIPASPYIKNGSSLHLTTHLSVDLREDYCVRPVT